MLVERIVPIPVTKIQAEEYARKAAETELNETVLRIKNLGGGSFGRAFGLTLKSGKEIVVKLLRAKNMMRKEAHDLELLRQNCNVNVPKVLFVRDADKSIPVDCYGMEKIEGKSAMFAFGMLFQSKKKRLIFAEKVTEALHRVHECQNPRFGDTLNPDCETWIDCYKPFAKEVLEKAEELYSEGNLSKKIILTMRAAWEKFDVIFSEEVTEACLIHGDLNINNIMVGKNHEITGFIDPLNSMYADREYDLFQFDNLTGKRFFLRKTYREKYGSSQFCDQKLAFYGLWNEVFCLIRAGTLVGFIMNPLVRNMKRKLKEL